MSPEILYAFEQTTERGIAAAFRALGATNVYESQATGEFPPIQARLVVESSAYARASTQQGWSRQGLPYYNHYRGTITIEINTPRANGVAYHQAMLGLVRRLFSAASGGLRLPPYDVLNATESAGNIAFAKEGERDVSRLTFALDLLIPSGLLDTAEKDTLPTPPTA